ncbi:hypothetical protein, partial [Cupriavidus basilensis]|uniref:hypothetical protein n=1 Tax=Cupriavidus basilensis TaxID=68895 RepID=UPI001ED93EC4
YDIPLRGLPVTFLCAAKKTNEKKAALPGAEQSGCSASVVASYGPECWLACLTGSRGIAMA